MSKTLTLEADRFQEAIRLNPEGSIFLGYLKVELVVDDVLDDRKPLKIGMPDLQVRITRNQKVRVDFPSDNTVIADTRSEELRASHREAGIADLDAPEGVETRWVARYFSASKETREAITRLVFQLPAVDRAVERAIRMVKSAVPADERDAAAA